jgi:hypothetical protein
MAQEVCRPDKFTRRARESDEQPMPLMVKKKTEIHPYFFHPKCACTDEGTDSFKPI